MKKFDEIRNSYFFTRNVSITFANERKGKAIRFWKYNW